MNKNTNLECFFVCYGKLNPNTVVGYKYVILEPFFYSEVEIEEFKKNNELVFAYISLGEINIYSKRYEELKPYTLGQNQNWNSFLLNLQNKETIHILKNEAEILIQKGYSGLFLDNLDNFGQFGKQTEQQDQLLELIKEIATKFPKHHFIQNGGLEFIGSTHKNVTAILLESIATLYDFDKNEYLLRPENDFTMRQKNIKMLTEKYRIPVLVLDYTDSKENYEEIKEKLHQCGFSFFISKIDLQSTPNYN